MRILIILALLLTFSCNSPEHSKGIEKVKRTPDSLKIELTLSEANRLAQLPLDCIQQPLPYKSGIVIAKDSDLAMPQEHHPSFFGCFDCDLTKTFERTYGWAWLLKLAEELYTWDDPIGKELHDNLMPLIDYISQAYQSYLPKLVYPIRVGEHSNTGFGLSFAYDYANTIGNDQLLESIRAAALRFYSDDKDCPISWEPSGYDFLSPCLQEMDIMRKVLNDDDFDLWSQQFLPKLFQAELVLEPGKIKDRSDGKLVHLDGLNFSRAWCLYSIEGCEPCEIIADRHLQYSLNKITDGDYAGQHWLASFALYAFQQKRRVENN